MKLALFSPVNPMKSGISDFTEELIEYLNPRCELSLFVPDEIINDTVLTSDYDIRKISDFEKTREFIKYDALLYQVGNNYAFHHEIVEAYLKYGGILELHDIALHHYYAEATIAKGHVNEYIKLMEYCHGAKGKKTAERYLQGKIKEPWTSESLIYTLNKYLIDRAQGIIVHSDFAKEMVKGVRSDVQVSVIRLHTPNILKNPKEETLESKKALGIPEDCLVMGAFGIASKEKQIGEILKALYKYKKIDNNFHFYIVGTVAGINLSHMIKNYDLSNHVTVLGHTSLELFKMYMKACDIAFNLRYPTQGESSASLTRLLGMGKTVFVNDVGSFKEYPDDIVVKIKPGKNEVKDIFDSLKRLKNEPDMFRTKTIEYANNNCSLELNAEKYIQVIKNHLNQVQEEEYVDTLITKIQDLIGLDAVYCNHISEKILF